MKYIIYSVIAVFLLAGGYFLFRNGIPFLGNKTTTSNIPDILFLTSPVTEFTGKVDKVSDKAIWVSGKYSITPPPTLPNNPTNIPGQVITVPPLPPTKTLTYKVNIASYTQITRSDITVTYLLNKNTPTPTPKLTVSDIKTGQMVTVSVTRDLRSNSSKEIEAYTIKLPPFMNKLTGKITSIKSNEGLIILKALTPARIILNEPTSAPVENEYAVSVTQATEISLMGTAETPKTGVSPKPPKPIKYEITDLKADIQITVYADSDVIDNHKIKALRIEPPADFVASKLSASSTPTNASQK